MNLNTILIISAVIICLAFEEASAIPVWARKYGASCTTCHVSIPKLNSFGEAFRFNGYRFPKETKDILEEAPVPLGGKPQEKQWPGNAIWPGEIPASPPLSIRTELDFNFSFNNEDEIVFDLPHEIYVLSGGNLGESISFFLELLLIKDGSFGGLRRSFLQFDSPIWDNKLLNVIIGQFEISAIPSSQIRRITSLSDNIINSFQNGLNTITLNTPRSGAELWGIKDGREGGGLFYSVGIVEAPSDSISSGGYAHKSSGKDIYARLSYKFGGLALSGESGPVPQGGSWRDNHLRLGGFYYSGNSSVSDYTRRGLDLRIQVQDLDLLLGMAFGKDDLYLSPASTMSFTAYFIEANYLFFPWMIGAVRFDAGFTPDDPLIDDINNLLLNLSFSIRPNVVVRTELLKELATQGSTVSRMRFDFAF